MPVNRNALIRYKTIDKCLQNPYRKWTLEDLIDACSDALYEYEGIDKGVSRRTVQADIQLMRSDKLGYNAPIIVVDKKYYEYEDRDYSITNIPLTQQDLGLLTEVVDILRQFKGFNHFKELSGMVQKLEDSIYVQSTHEDPIIDIEKNENLKGLEFLDTVYQAILKHKVLEISYQSFTAKKPGTIVFHPYLLKEYRNRWFILGRESDAQPIFTLALDRILEVKVIENEKYIRNYEFDPASYFKDVVGITVNKGLEPQEVKLLFNKELAPYILTKPIHHTQQVISETEQGIEIGVCVIPNYELEREIISFGENVEVIEPVKLKQKIEKRLEKAMKRYKS